MSALGTTTGVFLVVVSVLFAGAFSLPLLLAPRRWATWLRWRAEDGPLLSYFGRCLGAVAVAINAVCLRSAADPARHAVLLELIVIAATLLGLVHVRGALLRAQPWTEDVEIGLYAVVAAVALMLRLGA